MKHVQRVPYDYMFPIFTLLEQALVSGVIDNVEYAHKWAELLAATGWTDDAIETEVDNRWSTVNPTSKSFTC